MTPRVPAHLRAEIVRLRGEEQLTYEAIARVLGVSAGAVRDVCRLHFGDLVARAQAALRREIHLARAEAHSAPLYHPEGWG